MTRTLFNTADLANYFKVGVPTINRWVRDQRIPVIRASRNAVRYNLEAVIEALAQPVRRNANSK